MRYAITYYKCRAVANGLSFDDRRNWFTNNAATSLPLRILASRFDQFGSWLICRTRFRNSDFGYQNTLRHNERMRASAQNTEDFLNNVIRN